VDCSRGVGPLTHFWRSTGFTPATWLLRDDMKQSLAFIGGIPHHGILHVRIHYLLDLVSAGRLNSSKPWYDFSRLDEGLDALVSNGLKPFFELMGKPAEYFTSFHDLEQVRAWRDLVRALAEHLMKRYGAEEVESWYFETWNEPDGGDFWWKEDEEAFCNYYDACRAGLSDANPALQLGGPGTCFGLSPMLRTFLEHCDRGTDCLTGETGVRLDFISIHEKGAPPTKEDVNPDTQGICDREGTVFEYVRDHHPSLAGLPLMNNECDPQVGWGNNHSWRGKPYYAALAAKILNQHIQVLLDGLACRYGLLSNDNGFLGSWGQRTLLARLGTQTQCDEGRFELVRKPILSLMGLLGLLGDTRLSVAGREDAHADVGAIASRRNDSQVAILVYHSNDALDAKGEEHIEVALEGVPFDQATLAHYRIDAAHTNPMQVWEEMGRPESPTSEQLAHLRDHEGPALTEPLRTLDIAEGRAEIAFDLPLPGLSLLLLSTQPEDEPEKVTGLRARRYPGLEGQGQVMLSWTPAESYFVRCYEVLCAASPDERFVRVSAPGMLCAAFLHSGAPEGPVAYKVRAVDYWGRSGPEATLNVP
jgi:L-iduronidase